MEIRIFSFLVMLILMNSCNMKEESEPHEAKPNASPFSTNIYKTDVGWGFELLQSDKVIIRQNHIPAVEGEKPFNSKKETSQVAELMLYKIQHKIFPPSISKMELDSLKIKY